MTQHVVSRQRVEFAATGFLAEMRRQHTKYYPGQDCPVPTLQDYSPEARAILMAAIEKVIAMAGPSSDPAFAAWCDRKAQSQGQDPLAT
ncbi:MAG: hypothetical protein DI537_14030 [Stutzerimonas stutzeri]|nr:MAG: hypothetical protein DI537_14030 [Stutzerimonas stutzeri]